MAEHVNIYDDLCKRSAEAASHLYGRVRPIISLAENLEILAMCYAALRENPDITHLEVGPSDESDYSLLWGFVLADGTVTDSEGWDDKGEQCINDEYSEQEVEQYVNAIRWTDMPVWDSADGDHVLVDVHWCLKQWADTVAYIDPMPAPTDIEAVEQWLHGVENDLMPKEDAS